MMLCLIWLVLCFCCVRIDALATRRVVSDVDLQQTLAVIRQHWKTLETDDQEARQRALLTQILQQQRREARKVASQRAENSQRALLAYRLALERRERRLQARLEAQRVERQQRALLKTQLHQTAKKKADRQKLTEATQRALLAAQLAFKAKQVTEVARPYDQLQHTLLEHHKDKLIRMACAASPSQKLFPHYVTQVDILSLKGNDETNGTTMLVAILVCDAKQGDCVNVAVPIEFPSASTSTSSASNWIDFMLNQVDRMDQAAYDALEQAERALENNAMVGEPRSSAFSRASSATVRALLEEAPVFRFGGDIPDWWTTGDVELQRECDSLKAILNEDDFRQEILALARRHYQENRGSNGASVSLTDAGVALVGSSGLLLRAQLNDAKATSASSGTIVSVPVRFPDDTVVVVVRQDLQQQVLDLVDSVAATAE